jgi:hypothetical protein
MRNHRRGEEIMKSQMLILALVLVPFFVVGCKPKTVDEVPTQDESPAVEETAENETEEAEETAEAEVPEEHDMVVSLEDIEKAAEAYTFLHDEELTIDQKRARFDKFLEENNWAVDAYADLMYDISQHSTARAAYLEKIAN